jgi:hypothetical protein
MRTSLLPPLTPNIRPSIIRKFYLQKQFWHSDLSVIFVSTILIVQHKNSANHISQMENVWSCQHRIFVFNKNAFSVFRSSLDHCLLSTALLSRHRTVTIAPQITSFSMIRNDAYHDKAGAYTYKNKGRNESAIPDTARQLFERKAIRLCTVSSSTKRFCRTSTLVLYDESIRKTWVGHGIFKIVFIFVDQESQQKWNPFLLEIGYQSGANKNEIRIVFVFVFVCIRRMKATKMGKSRSNYSFLFLFLFLSRIRKGLSRLTWPDTEWKIHENDHTRRSRANLV